MWEHHSSINLTSQSLITNQDVKLQGGKSSQKQILNTRMCMLGGGGMSVCFLYMHGLVNAWRPGEDWMFYSITLHLIPLRQDLSH